MIKETPAVLCQGELFVTLKTCEKYVVIKHLFIYKSDSLFVFIGIYDSAKVATEFFQIRLTALNQ